MAPAGTDFSDDVFVSAVEVKDNNEVIENLSNLAFDRSGGGDLTSLNPKVFNYAQGSGTRCQMSSASDKWVYFHVSSAVTDKKIHTSTCKHFI